MLLPVLLPVLLLCCWAAVRADHFLREPAWLLEQPEPGPEPRAERRRRELPDWQARLRQKALSFGQSADEQDQVDFYLRKLNQLAEQRHGTQVSSGGAGRC